MTGNPILNTGGDDIVLEPSNNNLQIGVQE